MNSKNDHFGSPRVRDGEKCIAEPAEGPYQFDEVSDSQSVVTISNGTVRLYANLDELVDAMAAKVFTDATITVKKQGVFHLALSNATILTTLYERLMYDPNVRSLPWQATELWLTDQSAQFPEIVQETIVEHADIPEQQVHPLNAEELPQIDCLVVSEESIIPERLQAYRVLVCATTVETCEKFAKTVDGTVSGFVLRENH